MTGPERKLRPGRVAIQKTWTYALGFEVDHSCIACVPGRSMWTCSSTRVTQDMGIQWCWPRSSLVNLIMLPGSV